MASMERPKTADKVLGTRLSDAMVRNQWSDRQKLAIACQFLASHGHSYGLAGQISMRAVAQNHYMTSRFGLGFDEVTASSMVTVNDDLEVVEGDGIPNPAIRFHTWVYRARPDVQAIVHTHPPYCSALSTLKRELVVAHMDAMMLHDDCAYLADWPGVPVADEEGRIISEALGRKRAILLAHHGQLTACTSIEEATYLAFWIEHAAKMQMIAQSVGEMRSVEPELAREAHDFLLKPSIVNLTFDSWGRRVARMRPDCMQ